MQAPAAFCGCSIVGGCLDSALTQQHLGKHLVHQAYANVGTPNDVHCWHDQDWRQWHANGIFFSRWCWPDRADNHYIRAASSERYYFTWRHHGWEAHRLTKALAAERCDPHVRVAHGNQS